MWCAADKANNYTLCWSSLCSLSPSLIVLTHTLFILSVIVEYTVKQTASYSLLLMSFYFLMLGMKVWVIVTLGKFWNTKIFHIPEIPVIRKGFYLYFKHPNYMIVIIEIALIPCIFQLYITAIIFSILNLVMLYIRIKLENKVLKIWRCEDVKMWRCEDLKIWRFEDVKMWWWDNGMIWWWVDVMMSWFEDVTLI